MQIKKDLLKREIGGESFLIPMGKTVYSDNGMYLLTELGGFLWDRLPQARDEEDLLQAVLAEYDVEESTAKSDIRDFIEKLKNMEIL